MVGDRHDVTEIPVFQAAVRVRENRAADPGSNRGAGQGRDGTRSQPLVEVRAARGHEDHSPTRLIGAQLAAVTVRDRSDDSGDVAQGNGGDGRTPGLVEGARQAGPEDNERVGASRKGGEYPGTGHGLVVQESLGEARIDAHCSPSSAPSAYVREGSFSCARTRPALVAQ